jgi:hypothetical protein
MNCKTYLWSLFLICIGCTAIKNSSTSIHDKRAVIIKSGIKENGISAGWKDAVTTRMSQEELDSFSLIRRPLTMEEMGWQSLFEARTGDWSRWLDSLAIPFPGISMSDTINVLTGFLGVDDAFTYQHKTVCLDLTAFFKNYGSALLPENSNRADRIFAHEYTHLLHKAWAAKNNLAVNTFKDSVIWECMYEGLGMYRSLSPMWQLQHDSLPVITRQTLNELTPLFVEKMCLVQSNASLTAEQKKALQLNLSRGNVNKKWGATTVAIWLMLEARGNDKNLIYWINKGPAAVIGLAKKYLDGANKEQFQVVFGQ